MQNNGHIKPKYLYLQFKMNILHVIPSLKKGGAERITIDICNALSAQGHRVMLVSLNAENAYDFIDYHFEFKQITSQVIPSLSGKTLVDTEAYEQILDDFKPDVIHSHLFIAEMLTRYKTRKGIKYFSHLHDNMPQFNALSITNINKLKLTNFYEKQLIMKRYNLCNNRFIAISKDAYNFFYENLNGKLREQIFLLHNAIDYARFYRGKRVFKYDLDKPFRMVSVGSLVDKKNQQFLVDIALALSPLLPHLIIDILGDGPNYNLISEKIKKHNLQHCVFLHGNVNNVETFLHNAHLYIHPATYEPFGLVLLEAMAAGLPCVCLDGRGNRDIIEPEKNGYIFEEQNAELFAQTIFHLLTHPQQHAEMSDYASKYAANFDIHNYTKRLIALYEQN